MTSRTTRRPLLHALMGVMLIAVLLCAVPLAAAPSAGAAGQVTIDSDLGGTQVSSGAPTPIRVSGSGFQSIEGGFGGIYVLFGWARDGEWRPSQGGLTGDSYLYVPDSESKDNQGYQRFVTFPGSSTAETANGGEISPDGTWSLEMIVPGPTFQARDRDGNVQSVDCREVTCGVITVGAHGVVNANNESFTPVSFAGTGGGAATPKAPAESDISVPGAGAADAAPQGGESRDELAVSGQTAADQTTAGQAAAGTDASGASSSVAAAKEFTATGPASVGVDQPTIMAGRVLSFSAQGFAPGEQVMLSVGAGLAGVGPITAGQFGEVAGAVALPAQMRAGTHVLKVSGAGSGQTTEVSISVMSDPATLGSPADEQSTSGWTWAFVAAAVTGLLLLVLFLSSLITAIVRRNRTRAAQKTTEQKTTEQKTTEQKTTEQATDTAGGAAGDEGSRTTSRGTVVATR